MTSFNQCLKKLKIGINLNQKEAFLLQENIISGRLATEEILEIFNAFEKKSITFEELSGIVLATRNHMICLRTDFDVLDTCGTGGDGLNTFNISTVAAIVCAGAGIPIVKHGNRAATGICGSADLLEAIGVNIHLNVKQSLRCLQKCGMVFLFAPQFHPALKHVSQARKLFGKKTYFNIIGPMLNPANAAFQVIGVSDRSIVDIMGQTLMNNGSKRVTIVFGQNGMDEISTESETSVTEFGHEKLSKSYLIRPNHFQLKEYPIQKLQTKSIKENAKICLDVLENRARESHMNAVLLNAACGVMTFGKAKTMQEGVEIAHHSIESGKALLKLKKLIEVSNTL